MLPAHHWTALLIPLLVACADPKHPRAFVGRWHDVKTTNTLVTDYSVVRVANTPHDFELSADGTGTDPLDGDPMDWEVRVDTANIESLCFTPRAAIGGGRYCSTVFLRGDSLNSTDGKIDRYVRRH